MSKIQSLETVKGYIEIRRHRFVQHVQYLQFTNSHDVADYDKSLMIIGQATVLMSELYSHCMCLLGITAACEHGLAGTRPAGDEEWVREFGPFTENGEPAGYDPYQIILNYLTGVSLYLPCLTLSPALLAFIDMMPEMAGKSFEQDLFEQHGVLTHVDGDGTARPATDAEVQRLGDNAVLQALEQSFFATTYAADMAQVKDLVEQRGCFHQILALLN